MTDQILAFVSYTQAMKRHPPGTSFVASAEAAINAIESAKAHHMEYFAAADMPPAEYSLAHVRKATIFVAVIGLDFGSRVPGDPVRSYTELEFDAATELRLPRLAFLLDPASGHLVGQSSAMTPDQARFRRKVENSGATVAYFTSPDDLKYKVHAAVSQWIREASASRAGPSLRPLPHPPHSRPTGPRVASALGLAMLAVAAALVLGAWSAVAGTFPPWSQPAECAGIGAEVVSAVPTSFGDEQGTTLGVRLVNTTEGAATVPAARNAIVRTASGQQLAPDNKFADSSWFFDVTVQPGASLDLEVGVAGAQSGDPLTVVVSDVRHGMLRLARCTVTSPAVDPGAVG